MFYFYKKNLSKTGPCREESGQALDDCSLSYGDKSDRPFLCWALWSIYLVINTPLYETVAWNIPATFKINYCLLHIKVFINKEKRYRKGPYSFVFEITQKILILEDFDMSSRNRAVLKYTNKLGTALSIVFLVLFLLLFTSLLLSFLIKAITLNLLFLWKFALFCKI